MPNVLQTKVKEVLPFAVQKSIIATAIMGEKNEFAPQDNRPDEIKALESKLSGLGYSPALLTLAEYVTGHKMTLPRTLPVVKPAFLGALVLVRPFGIEAEEHSGIPWGTTVISVNTSSLRWRYGDKTVRTSFHGNFVRPATDEEVKKAVEDLFAARPALTLKLYGASIDSVHGVDGGEESE